MVEQGFRRVVFNYPSFFVSLAIMPKGLQKTTQSKKRMVAALEKCLGNVSDAIKKVDICSKTHYLWLDKDPEYAKDIDTIKEAAIDFVESKLFQIIEHLDTHFASYEGKIISEEYTKRYAPNATAIIFYLKTRAKHRGYIEHGNQFNPLTDKLEIILTEVDASKDNAK